jgi:Asp-tRNA(Asn)/Glu-tRNA(Gln) amidotransferase A subunit family amidase
VRSDGVIEPLPPIKRVLDDVVGALRKKGVQVEELDVTPLLKQCQSLANQFFGIDGNNGWLDLLEKTGEPLSPWLSTRLKRKKPHSLEKLRDLHAKRDELRNRFLSVWKDVDAFVCPVAPHPIPEIDRWNGVSWTSAFVLLDLPAGVSASLLSVSTYESS